MTADNAAALVLEETPNGPIPSDPPQDAPQDPEVVVIGDLDDQADELGADQ